MFIRTSPFREGPKYTGATIMRIEPTNDTNALIAVVVRALNKIYRSGYQYAKAGVCLMDIQQTTLVTSQLGLFDEQRQITTKPREELMKVMDNLNQRYGRFTLMAADALEKGDAAWRMRQQRKTPAYTTCWKDIVEIWR